MDPVSPLILALDLTGTFAFALNGALTAIRTVRIDVVGVFTLGILTALGGGIVRDVLLGVTPPATFGDWRYLAVAAGGSLVAFWFSGSLDRMASPILVLDGAGLSLFAVTGAIIALENETGFVQAVILGVTTAVGGGTLRDVLLRQVPVILHSELYAIPALVGALVVCFGDALELPLNVAAVVGAATCFALRMIGLRYGVNAPAPRSARFGSKRRRGDAAS